MAREKIEREEVKECFESLWEEAFRKHSTESICALLRISGIEGADWDTFIEAGEALEDYGWHIDVRDEKLSAKSSWRMGLLTYCQIFEMSAVHATLANLLRILKGERCHLNPLGYLNRPDKKKPFKYYPASARTKWKKIQEMAREVGKDDLVRLIDSICHDSVRNAFSHSDYILTEEYFRWTEGGLPSQISLVEVDTLILNTFRFISEFIRARNLWLHLAASMPRYHKWPNYEVFELLKNDDDPPMLIGFQLHHSNGSVSRYKRTPEGVDCCNIIIQGDGTIEYMRGLINALKQEWVVDGRTVDFKGEQACDHFEAEN